jgi:hypothetical protein
VAKSVALFITIIIIAVVDMASLASQHHQFDSAGPSRTLRGSAGRRWGVGGAPCSRHAVESRARSRGARGGGVFAPQGVPPSGPSQRDSWVDAKQCSVSR